MVEVEVEVVVVVVVIVVVACGGDEVRQTITCQQNCLYFYFTLISPSHPHTHIIEI